MRINRTLIFLACLALLTSAAWAVSSQTGKMQSSQTAQIIDHETYLDINNLLCFVYNDGNFAYDNANVFGKTDGLYFPRGTKKTVIYDAGIWIGAKVDGETRLAIAEYSSEFRQGPMSGGTYLPDSPDFKVFKINRGDTPESNPDYANWPSSMGAPVDSLGNPALLGDQMCWAVYNDADRSEHNNDAAGTEPLGVEIQQSTFAYGRSGSLGQVIFMKFLIINKGGNTLDSTFVSLWADPDLGDASDDLVGCDTTLSVGYCYNEAGGDGIYGAAPPAVGFDFFQGPVVEGEAEDSALFQGEWVYGMKNLPMTSFNKYINGTDPHSFVDTYNYMKGLKPNGDPVVDPEGDTTTFNVAGDPVAGTGWLDENAADRRYMMTSGPFTMLPGDTQEVVAAIVVGQGADRLKSITAMKQVDAQAQLVFDLGFDIPAPPPNPDVFVRNFDGAIDLIWDTKPEGPEGYVQDYIDKLGEFYIFEGYNIYQGLSSSGPWTKVATYDYDPTVQQHEYEDTAGAYYITCTGEGEEMVCDSVPRPWDFSLLYGFAVNSTAGGIEEVITQSGSNSGLLHHMHIERSLLDGGPIINNRPYYFAVTSYGVNIQQVGPQDSVFAGNTFLGFNAANLENVKVAQEAIPLSSTATLVDTATHDAGPSQGMIEIDYLTYTGTTADEYMVTFNADNTWNLLQGNTVVLSDQTNQSGDFVYQIVDGLMVRVMGPAFGIAPGANSVYGGIIEIQDASGPISPDNVFWSLDASGGWYVSSDVGGSSDAARARFNWQELMTWESWEFRFTETGSHYFNWDDGVAYEDPAPFEIWHYNENESEPDRQDVFEIIDDDASGGWTMGDRIYVIETAYPDPFPPNDGDVYYYEGLHLGRVIFNDNGGGVPETGVIVRFNSTIPNTALDTFTFVTKPVGSGPGTVIPDDLSEVQVIPNPYYNYSILEQDQFDRKIKFTGLPPAKCTIKIFNIAGDLVRELTKDNLYDAEMTWDVKTTSGLYVASGIYVYYIEAEGIGSTFGKMIVFTEVELLNTY